jgi:hypothetical protein
MLSPTEMACMRQCLKTSWSARYVAYNTDVSVSVPLEGVAAKLNIASNTPTEQRLRAIKTRGLKKPDWKEDFFACGVPC